MENKPKDQDELEVKIKQYSDVPFGTLFGNAMVSVKTNYVFKKASISTIEKSITTKYYAMTYCLIEGTQIVFLAGEDHYFTYDLEKDQILEQTGHKGSPTKCFYIPDQRMVIVADRQSGFQIVQLDGLKVLKKHLGLLVTVDQKHKNILMVQNNELVCLRMTDLHEKFRYKVPKLQAYSASSSITSFEEGIFIQGSDGFKILNHEDGKVEREVQFKDEKYRTSYLEVEHEGVNFFTIGGAHMTAIIDKSDLSIVLESTKYRRLALQKVSGKNYFIQTDTLKDSIKVAVLDGSDLKEVRSFEIEQSLFKTKRTFETYFVQNFTYIIFSLELEVIIYDTNSKKVVFRDTKIEESDCKIGVSNSNFKLLVSEDESLIVRETTYWGDDHNDCPEENSYVKLYQINWKKTQ